MHYGIRVPVKEVGLGLVIALLFLSQTKACNRTRVDLTEGGTGRRVFSGLLREGEQAVMQWKNSLFGLDVLEVFQARQGRLVLNQVTFYDPLGKPPPEVTPADVEDLYHTGGPFTAQGLEKPFSRVIYRVGEMGNPRMRVGHCIVSFAKEVGFGGSIILTTSSPTWWEVLRHTWVCGPN